MVKGVNKTIIEINDTGSRYFDRVLLFVNPERCDESPKKLERRAIDYVSTLSGKHSHSVKKDCRRERSIAFLLVAGISVAVVVLALILLF